MKMNNLFIRCGKCGKELGSVDNCLYSDCYYKDKNGDTIFSPKYNEPNDIEILNTESYRAEFPNLSDSDIMWSQHQIILKQKKQIAELEAALIGHNISLNGNY
jgi:hypothetical protein